MPLNSVQNTSHSPQGYYIGDDGKPVIVYTKDGQIPLHIPSLIPIQGQAQQKQKNNWWRKALAGLGTIGIAASIGAYALGRKIHTEKIQSANAILPQLIKNVETVGTQGRFMYIFFEGAKNKRDLNEHYQMVSANDLKNHEQPIQQIGDELSKSLKKDYKLYTSFVVNNGKVLPRLSNHWNHLKQGSYRFNTTFKQIFQRGLSNNKVEFQPKENELDKQKQERASKAHLN